MEGKRFSRRTLWLAFAACYLSASCVMSPRQKKAGPHQWNESRGPVVPHDTFPKDCSLCHEGGSWEKIRSDFHFDHARETGVALVGAHKDAECLRCHNDRGPVAAFAQRSCVGCHEDEHRGQLGARCVECHNESNWVPEGQIVLHNRTRFPLFGAHTAVACFRCHPGAQVGNFVRAPVRCEACHQSDLARAKDPDHLAQGWTQNCDRCHKPTTWNGAGFDHSTFPLTGAHVMAACSDCHSNGVYSGLPSDCVDCHLPDFQTAASPNHVAGNFPTDCQSCHNTVSWHGAMFNHTGITSGCVQCHLPDYQGATSPDHVAGNFPTNCEQCHNTMSWQGATFNHAGITTGCVQCHLPDYQTTSNPNHIAAGFPQNCESCHNTNTWLGATFSHQFNINSGPHRSFSCAECHQTPANYQIVSCIHCHEHRQSVADDKHSGVPGYSWNSAACVSCHPNGN
jgi:hypothetical protein